MKNLIKNKWKSILLCLAYLLILLFIASIKNGYNVDELVNFTLANSYHWFSPDDGIDYIPANQPFVETMASNGKIDFSHVWEMQRRDGNHPPVYYALIHVACSILTPNVVSKWGPALVNIIFHLLTLLYVRRTLEVLKIKDPIKECICVGFVLCGGILNLSAFYRMYSMLLFITTLFNYIVLKNIEKYSITAYMQLYVVVVIGALTQYYFIFSAFFISLVLTIMLIIDKRYKEVFLYCITMLLDGLTAVAIFPDMIYQLFAGGNGEEAWANMFEKNIFEQLKAFIALIDAQLFGGLLVPVVIILILAFLIDIIKNGRDKRLITYKKYEKYQYQIMVISSILFVVFVAKSALYNQDRYVAPIYGVMLIVIYSLIYKVLFSLIKNESMAAILNVFVIVMVTGVCLAKADWGYVQRENTSFDYAKSNFEDAEAIVFWEGKGSEFRILTSYLEVSECEKAKYFKMDSSSDFTKEVNLKDLPKEIVLVTAVDESEKILQLFLSEDNGYTLVNSFDKGYSDIYYLTK